MSLLPSKPDASPSEEAGPRVVGVDSEEADEVLSALSSGTARRLLSEVHDDPAPPSELAERVDTSLQNAQYHLEKLENAGAIEVVDTAYSAKGREMDVYAAADKPLVIFAGDQEEGSTLRTALRRLVGALGALAVASLAVQALFGREDLLGSGDGGDSAAPAGGGADGGGDGGTEAVDSGDGGDGGDGAQAVDSGDGGDGGGGDVDTVSGGDGGDAAGSPTPDPETTVQDRAVTPTPGGEATPQTTPAPEPTPTPQPEPTGTPAPEPTGTPAPRPEPTPTPQPEPTGTPTETFETATGTAREAGQEAVRTAADVGPEAAGGLPPGLVFFAGGAFVAVVVAAAWYWRG